jgi:hypothetical protein
VGRQGGVEKENKTLGTERCENIKNLVVVVVVWLNIPLIMSAFG